MGFKVNDLNTGCDSVFGRWVYVPVTPVVDWSSAGGCDGDIITFTNKTIQSKGLTEYKWNFGDPNSLDDNTSTISDPVHKFSTYGQYTITQTAWNFEFPKFVYISTKVISISPVPTVCFKVKNACEGTSLEYINCTTAPVSGNITYSWNFGDGTAKSTLKDPTHKYLKPGGYQTTLTASLNGCVASLSKNANQFAMPKADFSVSGKCNFEEIKFTNGTTISQGKSGYNWDFGDNSVSNLTNPTHSFNLPGNHTVKLTARSEFGCENVITKKITLNESPEADFTYGALCNLTPVAFTRVGSLPTGNSIYQWDFNGESVSTKENPSHLFSTVGVKQVKLLVSSDNGCKDMITKEFVVKLQAKADFVAKSVCEGENVVFTNKSYVASGNLNYHWKFGDGTNANITSPRHTYELQKVGETESFTVTLVALVPGGCADSLAKTVTVNAKSDATFTPIISGRKLTIESQTTKDPLNIYNWRFGEGGRSNEISPTYEYANVDKGTYKVCLSIINNAGCISEHCENISINLLNINQLNTGRFQVYPNPSNGLVTVQFINTINEGTIDVLDAAGKIIYTNENISALGSTIELDLSEFAAGIYFIRLTADGTAAVERVSLTK